MAYLQEKLDARLGRPRHAKALLVLEDGTVFPGRACGAAGEVFGEVCFNTSMTGYGEVLTDPSYAGQIVCMSYPQIGNYGMCTEDNQANHPALKGFVVHDLCMNPSNWRSTLPLHEYLLQEGVVAIEGVDTRQLIKHIRDHGAMRACISTVCEDAAAIRERILASEPLGAVNWVAAVSGVNTASPAVAADAPEASGRWHVVAFDSGMKTDIIRQLEASGCRVTVLPWDATAEQALALNPDGVFLSNGPGDPDVLTEIHVQIRKMLGKVPIFGICLGHQNLCKAACATIAKLPFGHHGGNQPVQDLLTGRVEITAQNHGYNVNFDSLGAPVEVEADSPFANCKVVLNPGYGRIALTHVNLNDGTAEGVTFLDVPAFSVQYHPEGAPGPTDAHYLFERFVALMEKGVACYAEM